MPTVQYSILRTVEMNTLLSLGCLLVPVIAQVTYIYFRRRNSLRKLQGPESTSLLLGEFSTYTHLCSSPYAALQGTRVTSVIKMRSETVNSSGCENTVLHGVDVGR